MPFRQLAAVHEPTNVTTDPSLKKRIKTDDIATHENIMSLRLAHRTERIDGCRTSAVSPFSRQQQQQYQSAGIDTTIPTRMRENSDATAGDLSLLLDHQVL